MNLVYDIETDGLLHDMTQIWCIVAYDLKTDKVYRFTNQNDNYLTIADGIELLKKAQLLIGHNVIGFDHAAILKMSGVDLYEVKTHDTFVMSQVLRYKRKHKHGLAGWGEQLQNSKWDFDKFDSYSKDMLRYCEQDVRLNVDIYKTLVAEFMHVAERNPLIAEGMNVEHDVAILNAIMRREGWNFDADKAQENLARMEAEMKRIEDEIHPKLGERKVYKDKAPKTPKYKKNGDYTAVTARLLSEYLGHPVKETDTHLVPAGTEYQRYTVEPITLGNMDLVKDWLLDNGWKPDEYQRKKVGWEWVTMGPKLTSTSLRKLGKIGEDIDDYYTLRNRSSVIRGWLESLRSGRLHGSMWTIGTPTFRCRHEVIVNLPATSASWGRELRELFRADRGHILVGADSSGNQLRGLCHYVDNEDFTHEVIHGDQHQRNADALGCTRPVAKSYLYAYLFGAGDAKLGQVLTGVHNTAKGKESREKFAASIKGLNELRKKLSDQWKQTHFGQGEGWFPALDGRPVFCGSDHQALNYLLQSAEGITCKAAFSWAWREIKAQGLRAKPRIFYHDEQAWSVHPDDAEEVGKILQASFREAPKVFNVTCMDGGEPTMGDNYAEVH